MQYYQTCLELDSLIQSYEQLKIEVKIKQAKINRLRETSDELKELKAQQHELGLRSLEVTLKATERELEILIDIFFSFPKHYTRAEIEEGQPEYWDKRLTGNAEKMLMGGSGVNYAHIEAMEQAGILEKLIAEVEASRKELS